MLLVAAEANAAYPVSFERGVAVPMRDGVKLYADIYRLEAAQGQFPVLLQRTPYDKSYGHEFGLKAAAQTITRRSQFQLCTSLPGADVPRQGGGDQEVHLKRSSGTTVEPLTVEAARRRYGTRADSPAASNRGLAQPAPDPDTTIIRVQA